MKTPLVSSITLALAAAACAGSRASTDYTITPDVIDSGGLAATSTNYSNDGSIGGIVGISAVSPPAVTAKHGYIGQLYELSVLDLSASPPTIDEEGTRQLLAQATMDDLTTLSVAASEVSWSVLVGPLTGIDASGLATAGVVYQDTEATAQGIYQGVAGQLTLTVLDTIADNYGSYAGDELGDDWQVQYFGEPPNADAGPTVDPDGDGQNNRFEFIAGIDPVDPNSRFLLRIEPVSGESTHKDLIFSPRLEDRTYIVTSSPDLSPASFIPLSSTSTADAGDERTVTDLDASDTEKFYRVDITKP